MTVIAAAHARLTENVGAPPYRPVHGSSRFRSGPGAACGTVGVQLAFDELDEPLRETAFVVVDLETTGGRGRARRDHRDRRRPGLRGGVLEAEFQTLVEPGCPISPFVSVLTGITNGMVADAPSLEAVLPAFLESRPRRACWSRTTRRSTWAFCGWRCHATGYAWHNPAVIVDTAVLARRVLTRDEVPNCRLSTPRTVSSTRAPSRSTARWPTRAPRSTLLHGLIERVGSLGVQSLPGAAARSPTRCHWSSVASAIWPTTSTTSRASTSSGTRAASRCTSGRARTLRSRVRNYFVASETRSRIGEMVGLAERVDGIQCAHSLEAAVRELRLIAAHKPRYNRRSKFPERSVWLKLTDEAYPRLSIVRDVRPDGAAYLGPLRTMRQAEAVRDAIHDAVPLRQCSDRLSVRRQVRGACALAEIRRCTAPCEHRIEPAQYARLAETVAAAWQGDVEPR